MNNISFDRSSCSINATDVTRVTRVTLESDTRDIHPKKDNVCGIQFFSPKKPAEKVRTF